MSYQVHQYHSKKPTEQKIVEGFFKGLWWIIYTPFRLVFKKRKVQSNRDSSGVRLDQGYVQQKWQEIERLMRLGRPSNFSRAVLEADKLLDHVLKSLRAPGLTMGDRLKAAKNRFSPEAYNAAWRGHKVRNEIVHTSDYEITDFMAREAISNFKKALRELVEF